ncbi:MAG TPA: hypothetical protein VHB25_15120 [Gemmatimonadaceae bacterium]|nr:hypothetical protein [Gemmatimonadaceae bacterium]
MSGRFACAACALLVLALSARPAAAQQFPLKAGITVVPDTVRIGDPFRFTVGVRAPRGATIEFPASMDSAATVQSLDKVVVRTSADSSAVEQYADYRVAAWDVGVQPIRLPDVLVHLNGATRRVPIADSVFVRSVLPPDSAQRVPKPPRDLMIVRVIPWWLWALIAAAIAIVGLLIWWWIRRRRRPKPPVIVDPFEAAEAEFARIEALGLLEAGERARYLTLMVEVLRDYLAARYVQASLSLTTTELQRSIRDLPHVPQERVIRVLTEADLIKFARRAVSTDRARELGREARAIVADEHRASQPAPEPGQEAAA